MATSKKATKKATTKKAVKVLNSSPTKQNLGKGAKNQLRSLYAQKGTAYTKSQLIALTGATWVTLATGITDLKNPKYANGALLNVTRVKGTNKVNPTYALSV